MRIGKINIRLTNWEVVNGSKWKVFVDGKYVGSLDNGEDLCVTVTKGKHRVKFKDDKHWTDALEVSMAEEDIRVEYVLGEENSSFHVIDAYGCWEKSVMLTQTVTKDKPKKNGNTSSVLMWLTCIGVALLVICGIAVGDGSKKKQENITIPDEVTDKEIPVSASDKIEKEISEFANSFNEFYEKNLVNDDDVAYENVLESFHLEANYFKQYEYDENVYTTQYYSGGVYFIIMLYMNDKNEIAEVRAGTEPETHPNGKEGAYELLRVVSYGCIYATNKDMSKSEIAELFKNTCMNEGSVNEYNGVEYYATGTDELMTFIITVDEELFIG